MENVAARDLGRRVGDDVRNAFDLDGRLDGSDEVLLLLNETRVFVVRAQAAPERAMIEPEDDPELVASAAFSPALATDPPAP